MTKTNTPIVTLKDNTIVTNSRDVADFGKAHRTVLPSLDVLLHEIVQQGETVSDFFIGGMHGFMQASFVNDRNVELVEMGVPDFRETPIRSITSAVLRR